MCFELAYVNADIYDKYMIFTMICILKVYAHVEGLADLRVEKSKGTHAGRNNIHIPYAPNPRDRFARRKDPVPTHPGNLRFSRQPGTMVGPNA